MSLYMEEKEIQALTTHVILLYKVKSGAKSKSIEMLCEYFPIRRFIFRIQKGDSASHASFWILSIEFLW